MRRCRGAGIFSDRIAQDPCLVFSERRATRRVSLQRAASRAVAKEHTIPEDNRASRSRLLELRLNSLGLLGSRRSRHPVAHRPGPKWSAGQNAKSDAVQAGQMVSLVEGIQHDRSTTSLTIRDAISVTAFIPLSTVARARVGHASKVLATGLRAAPPMLAQHDNRCCAGCMQFGYAGL